VVDVDDSDQHHAAHRLAAALLHGPELGAGNGALIVPVLQRTGPAHLGLHLGTGRSAQPPTLGLVKLLGPHAALSTGVDRQDRVELQLDGVQAPDFGRSIVGKRDVSAVARNVLELVVLIVLRTNRLHHNRTWVKTNQDK
jgi:hypothetical protein